MALTGRVLCINPCYPRDIWPSVVQNGVTLPGGGAKLKPVLEMNTNASCDSCEILAGLMVQLSPFLSSLQLPLCLLDCLKSLVDPNQTDPSPSVLAAFKDLILGLPTPSVTDPINAIANAVSKCVPCITGWALPSICALVRDILDVVIGLLNCAISAMQKLGLISLKVTTMAADTSAEIQQASVCLEGLLRVQRANLNEKLDLIRALLDAIGFLFSFTGISLSVNLFDSISEDSGINDTIKLLQDIVGTLQTAKTAAEGCC